MNLVFFYIFLTMLPGHGGESIASRGGSEANMSCLPTELHEDSVARPLFPTNKRDDDKNLGVLGCKNPTVMITRTRSVCRGALPLDIGIVNSGTTPSVGTPTVQGTNLVPQPVCSNRKGTGTIRPILERKMEEIPRDSLTRKKKRNYVYFNKNKKFKPVSQLEPISVCVPINDNVIEAFNNNPVLNPHFNPKSQEDKKKQIAFRNRLNYMRKKREKRILRENLESN